jgi:hypothetical protein
LLDAMIAQGMDQKTTRRLFVLGGECNYLCQCNSGVLEPIEYNSPRFKKNPRFHFRMFLERSYALQYRYHHWATAEMKTWTSEGIKYEFESSSLLRTSITLIDLP